jgi:hypothetical protein
MLGSYDLPGVSFPVLALASVQTCAAVIAIGVFFHFGIAVSMGLNNFVRSFPACYPAVWKVAADLHAASTFS